MSAEVCSMAPAPAAPIPPGRGSEGRIPAPTPLYTPVRLVAGAAGEPGRSALSDLGEVIERILQLQKLAATDVPSSCREALEQARVRASQDAELRELLADLGAALVDALIAGQGSEFVAVLAEAFASPAPSPPPASTVPASGDAEAATQPIPPEATETAGGATGTALSDPVEAPRPQTVMITPDVLRALQRRIHQNGLQRDVRLSAHGRDQHRQQLEKLNRYVEVFGPTPALLNEAAALEAEIQRLEQLICDVPHHWADVGKEANHALTAWAAARARAAQDAARQQELAEEVHRLDLLFPRLSRHSSTSRPGMVHGLARSHQPLGACWLDDARGQEQRIRHVLADEGVAPAAAPPGPPNHDDALRCLTEELRGELDADAFCQRARALLAAGLPPTEIRLVRLARPYLADLVGPDLAPLRRAVERELDAEVTAANGDGPLPADWPWYSCTRGKHAAIVGGEPRQERRERLQEVFGFASLEWLPNPTRGVRRVVALTQQMRAGSLDLVIVLRAFVGHGVSDKVFDAETSSCRTILAENYGVTQVRLGIERFLAGAVSEVAGS